jgi:Endonuclease NucS
MEDKYPGLWPRWFKNQCVAVGWHAAWGYTLDGKSPHKSWTEARNCLKRVQERDLLVVQLAHNRVGRVGEVIRKNVGDQEWQPLVPPNKEEVDGEMGRRVLVRWDLTVGPFDPDLVVELPPSARLPRDVIRPTIRELDPTTFQAIKTAMQDDANWVSLLSYFEYERSLSDYIGTFPHHLEDGLQPYPSAKVREKVFQDRTRLDVLLIDREGNPVVVECKQGSPVIADINQLQGYRDRVKEETGLEARGILVHGGARNLRDEVRRRVERDPKLEVVQYALAVQFARSK